MPLKQRNLIIQQLWFPVFYIYIYNGIECTGQKRYKPLMLSSSMISWKYITVILAFCNHCIFFFYKLLTQEAGSGWQLLVDCLNDLKSDTHEKDSVWKLSPKIRAYVKSNETGWAEHRYTRTTKLFTWSCSV